MGVVIIDPGGSTFAPFSLPADHRRPRAIIDIIDIPAEICQKPRKKTNTPGTGLIVVPEQGFIPI